jgi:hypothetical protein
MPQLNQSAYLGIILIADAGGTNHD